MRHNFSKHVPLQPLHTMILQRKISFFAAHRFFFPLLRPILLTADLVTAIFGNGVERGLHLGSLLTLIRHNNERCMSIMR